MYTPLPEAPFPLHVSYHNPVRVPEHFDQWTHTVFTPFVWLPPESTTTPRLAHATDVSGLHPFIASSDRCVGTLLFIYPSDR